MGSEFSVVNTSGCPKCKYLVCQCNPDPSAARNADLEARVRELEGVLGELTEAVTMPLALIVGEIDRIKGGEALRLRRAWDAAKRLTPK